MDRAFFGLGPGFDGVLLCGGSVGRVCRYTVEAMAGGTWPASGFGAE